jgi:hypothetical protein
VTGANTGARVALLSRRHCHACELAREDIRRVCAELGVGWTEQDVDADPQLCAEYGDRVPVTLVDGAEHACWGVEESRLRRALLTSAHLGGA